jgi:U3 small nucleolar RNA-associated protein 21
MVNLVKDASLLEEMKAMGPSAIDIEVRSLGEDMGGSIELMQRFLHFILYILSTKRNFELANAYLGLFLKIHGEEVSKSDELIATLEQIKEVHDLNWSRLEAYFNKSLSVVSYIKSAF